MPRKIELSVGRRGFVLGAAALAGCASVAPADAPPAPAAPRAFTKREVTFNNGDVRLAGDLYTPDGVAHEPAIVFGHGSGRVARPNPRFTFEAEGLAQRGFACLVFDKRGCGQSTGDWRTSDFEALAGDLRVAFDFMGAQASVDGGRVGLRGASQAGYVMPIAAARQPQPAFVILISAPMITIADQITFENETNLRAANLAADDMAAAMNLLRQALDVARTGTGAEAYFARVREAMETPWYRASPTPPEEERWFFDWLRPIHAFDPAPYFREMTMPVLAFFGQNDTLVPAQIARQRLEALYTGPRRRLLTVIDYPNAGHDLRYPNAAGHRILAPDYLDRMAAWINAALA